MSIAHHLEQLYARIPQHVSLVAVSKFQPVSLIREAYTAGQRVFGENRSREMSEKIPLLPRDVQWHFIGHLQTNKVREVVGKAVLIQSADRVSVLKAIQLQAQRLGIVQDVLLQVYIAGEDTKQGFLPEELTSVAGLSLPNVRVCGVMGMATFTEDLQRVRKEFRGLRELFETLKKGPYAGSEAFRHCSMGMSGDYHIALEEGSTMVRIGSAIFPPRPQRP